MKHAIIAACGAFTVASTLTLAAQTPPTPQTPKPSPSTTARTDEKTTTITGCLKAWDATTGAPATGTPTTPGTTPASRFVLTNVEPDAMGAHREGAATPGTTTTAMGAKQYVLTADAGVNLAAHLNHKIRVTGKAATMADHSATGSTRPSETARPGEVPAPAPTDPAPTTGRNDVAKAWPTLTVSSVTMVSATCTGATL